jgi:hypothetical protein
MLGLDPLGSSNDGQSLVASGVTVIGCVVHRSVRLLLADYVKCDTRPCRIPSALAAHFAGRLSIIDDFA